MEGKTNKNKVEKVELGCNFMGKIFKFKTNKLRNSSSVHSLPIKTINNPQQKESKGSPNHDSKISTEPQPQKSITFSHTPTDSARSSIQQKEPNGNSSGLARISTSSRPRENENKSPSKDLSTIKLTGNLLTNSSYNSPRTSITKNNKELNSVPCSLNNSVMGNIMRKSGDGVAQFRSPRSNRVVDPEVLKSMGNEAYKQGRFSEALALYERAIAIDSNKATYHCNKSAALIGLGRLKDAIVECEEAIRIEPSYARAHSRLATIYFRLGEAEKALNCNKETPYFDSELAHQAQALQIHLDKCSEARKGNDWKVILKETKSAISLGADSAPKVYALQTEALLKLLRHQEAYATYEKISKLDLDWCNKLFGPVSSAYLLMIGAQVYLATGRFEDAVKASQQAAKLDPSNSDVNAVVRRARATTSARLSGNLLFKASKFTEAYAVYNEGLEHDPFNSVLLCNRAACRSKLGQFEKAIEDCNVALTVQPSYSKAVLRRANCNAKLERWEAAIQDYEMLIREKPGDEEVARALFEIQLKLKIMRGEDTKDLKFGSNLFCISTNDKFRHYVTSPGMSVVLFCNKVTHKQVLLVLEQTCKRFPSVNFLKVEIEDHPYLTKSEGVNSVPAFKIYKNGSRVKEISGNNHELLERSIKLYSS
ncbi:inactive TPR repeat-containing thioredoxin TTL3 isoform X2 [Trifolium pratense]|uniref:inactive TPR repeat-containing thioredoxin TTL3 isoform X2 n=1 Tax=Trifolium pratense TaxID=57577 RepID=UPI001E692745|nr:inactive TPR repeat-containing thioredoxin TTL3 isoform X2 [Trifolium pratense]